MRITTEDIARICGVSRGTVDRALNNRPGISPKTKEKVLKVAKELGYRPNMIARSLAKGHTMSIGVVVFDLNNEFFAQLLNSIEIRARELGYFTYLVLTQKDPKVEKECLSHLVDRNVDGIILFSINKGYKFDDFLKNLHKPIISILNFISYQFPFIGVDEMHCMMDAVNLAVKKGYSHLIYVSPPLAQDNKHNTYTLEQRLKGFIQGCKENKLDQSNYTIINNYDYIKQLDDIVRSKTSTNPDNRTAILCSSDIYALEILRYLEAQGFKIPHDIGVMGFDNINTLKYVKPGLTTISYPIDDIAVKAVDSLIKIIKGEEISNTSFLSHSIIERESL